MEATSQAAGSPFMPTGDAMDDGVGPASWVPRADVPELDGKGFPKLRPMAHCHGFEVSSGRAPRGMEVATKDMKKAGIVKEMWVDEPEQMVRYLEIELQAPWGEGKRLVPMTFARIRSDRVQIRSIFGKHFAGVPVHASPRQVTLLEEDKIAGYYGGGTLYASEARLAPQLG